MIMLWMIFIVASLSSLYDQMDSETKSFFMFGPNKNLMVFGIVINTYSKYSVIVVYALINSLLRTSCRDVLISWQTNNVQDISKPKKKKIRCFAYEVVCVTTIYNWLDWYIYMNLLLAQVDMLIIEISSDLLMSCIITRYYLNFKVKTDTELSFDDTPVFNVILNKEMPSLSLVND